MTTSESVTHKRRLAKVREGRLAKVREGRLAKVREGRLARVGEVFAGHPENGTPEDPTQAGLIALAKEGAQVWNAWREEWPEPEVNFAGMDLRGDGLDFCGYQFGEKADFKGTLFFGLSNFSGARFGRAANFSGARFGGVGLFTGAKFGDSADFTGTAFEFLANFMGTEFGAKAKFTSAAFPDIAAFDCCQFGAQANFEGALFGAVASFRGTQFGAGATFAALSSALIERSWSQALVDGEALRRHIEWARAWDLDGSVFRTIVFSGAQFDGYVSFQNRSFLGTTRFDGLKQRLSEGGRTIEPRPTRFLGIPNFHGCTLHQDTAFDEESFEKVPRDKDAARAFRTLKLAMAQHQATREEQIFFRLEMEAERPSKKGWKRILFELYKWLSDYGFGFWPPFVLWAACFGVFGLIHASIADPSLLREHGDNPHWSQWWQYVFINAVPLPGFDRVQEPLRLALFCTEGVRSVALVIEAVHKTASLIALFLFGLALRNLFKMKG